MLVLDHTILNTLRCIAHTCRYEELNYFHVPDESFRIKS